MCPIIGLFVLLLPFFHGSKGTFPDDLIPAVPCQVATWLDEPPAKRRP